MPIIHKQMSNQTQPPQKLQTYKYHIDIEFAENGVIITQFGIRPKVMPYTVTDYAFDVVIDLIRQRFKQEATTHIPQEKTYLCPKCKHNTLSLTKDWQCSNCGYTIKHYER